MDLKQTSKRHLFLFVCPLDTCGSIVQNVIFFPNAIMSWEELLFKTR